MVGGGVAIEVGLLPRGVGAVVVKNVGDGVGVGVGVCFATKKNGFLLRYTVANGFGNAVANGFANGCTSVGLGFGLELLPRGIGVVAVKIVWDGLGIGVKLRFGAKKDGFVPSYSVVIGCFIIGDGVWLEVGLLPRSIGVVVLKNVTHVEVCFGDDFGSFIGIFW